MAQTSGVVLNGQVGLLTSRQFLAAKGAAYNVTNSTPGTAIAYANQTSFSATANGLFIVSNNNAVGGANIYLDRLKLIQTATAPTGTLVARFEVFNETGIVAMTGNVATRTPVQLNTGAGFAQTTGAVVQSFAAGAGTVPAAVGTRRLQDIIALQCGVSVIHDEWVVDFGSDGTSPGTAGLTAARATDPARISAQGAAIVIAPQTTSWINAWTLTGAANIPSYEFSLTYVEV